MRHLAGTIGCKCRCQVASTWQKASRRFVMLVDYIMANRSTSMNITLIKFSCVTMEVVG